MALDKVTDTVLSRLPIEQMLELICVGDEAPDVFTNARQHWQDPEARGVFGGLAVAQSLGAAQATVPSKFTVHSMHCYFLLAVNSRMPIFYHVERVRDGRNFVTRTVQARQQGRCVFTASLSFVRGQDGTGTRQCLQHGICMPTDELPPPAGVTTYPASPGSEVQAFETTRCTVTPDTAPSSRRMRLWMRAVDPDRKRGPNAWQEKGSPQHSNGPHEDRECQSHLVALADMSDSYFVDTIVRVHGLIPFANQRNTKTTSDKSHSRNIGGESLYDCKGDDVAGSLIVNPARGPLRAGGRVEMMVSLSHTVYFHNPTAVRADEWMLVDLESPWAGHERGLAVQRIWSKSGVLLATCVQKGLVRLNPSSGTRL
jgi:acyl-coenzyme A thioesterase 1/2/4